MKEQQPLNQHFIPQCYLRGFSDDGKHIHLYRKEHKKSDSRQSIAKTASRYNFYTIPEKYFDREKMAGFDPYFYEKDFFSEYFENEFGPLLKLTNEKASSFLKTGVVQPEVLSLHDIQVLAYQIAVQYLRMPNIRSKYSSFQEKASVARLEIIKGFMKAEYPDHKEFLDSITVQYDKNYDPVQHAILFSDPNIIHNMQDNLLEKIWIFYVTDRGQFYTSDNPVLIKPHEEVIFPIGNHVLLSMKDPEYYPNDRTQHNQFQLINAKQQRAYNAFQYIWANEEVYCRINDFRLIELLIEINEGKEIKMQLEKILVNGK